MNTPPFLCCAKYLSLLCHERINTVSLVVLRSNFTKGLGQSRKCQSSFLPICRHVSLLLPLCHTKDEGTKIAYFHSNAYSGWLEYLEKLHLRVVVWWCQAGPDPKREQSHSSKAVCASPFLLYWHISVTVLQGSLRNCSASSQWDRFPGLIQKHSCVFKQRTCVGRMGSNRKSRRQDSFF